MTMRCQEIVDLLVDYLDAELNDEQQRRLEAHLDACPECVDFIASHRETGAICRDALSVQMPMALKSSLSDFLRTELKSVNP